MRSAAAPALAIALALLAGAGLVGAIGESPLEAGAAILRGAFGSPAALGATLFQATTLVFVGLAVALPYRAGFFNIGAEGQLLVGALAAAVTALAFPALPRVLLLPLAVGASAAAGALWGAIPGFLRARFGVHEVIDTIMMNFIASALTSWFVVYVVQEPGQMIPHTRPIPEAAEVPRLGELAILGNPFPASSPVNASILLAIAALAAYAWGLRRTSAGFELRAVGVGERAARVAGIASGRIAWMAMAAGGALAGLAGVNEVLGFRHRFLDNFSGGVGFLGIAVALLGKSSARGVFAAALFLGALAAGAVEVDLFTDVPREILIVLQAMILLAVVGVDEAWSALARARRRGAGRA
jgi:simple sugar transport system permease protein